MIAPNLAHGQPDLEFEENFPKVTFERPLDMDVDAGSRAYISTQAGKILTLMNDPAASSPSVFLDLTDEVAYSDNSQEAGYLNTALHPNFQENGFLYVFYLSTGRMTDGTDTTHTVLARYQRSEDDPKKVDQKSRTVILEIPKPTLAHNGGGLAFGPNGHLYISVGDGSRGGDQYNQAQDRRTLLGSILRLDVDRRSENRNYGIPPSNPYVDNTQGFREEIFAYGFRNPWRMTIDPETGDIWLGDVGEHSWEEINFVEKGKNYGWPIKEGPECFDAESCDESGLTDPIHAYPYGAETGRCVTGGYVYRGSDIPDLQGKYVFGDWATERIWVLNYDEENQDTTVTQIPVADQISKHYPSFAVDDQGELYFLSLFHGFVYKFRPASKDTRAPDTTGLADSAFEITGPNPSVRGTSVTFRLAETGPVEIVLYDVLGRRISVLHNGIAVAGQRRSVRIPSTELAAGTYLVRLRSRGTTRTRTIHILE